MHKTLIVGPEGWPPTSMKGILFPLFLCIRSTYKQLYYALADIQAPLVFIFGPP